MTLKICLRTFFLLILFCLVACTSRNDALIVYVSVDQNYAEPVLKKFEQQTGIRVLAVYDLEASKTTGLVNRILAEKKNPQAAVFWSGEFVQTIALKQAQQLEPYLSHNAAEIPPQFKDPAGYWTGFAGRARVFIVNTEILEPHQYPGSLSDMLNGPVPTKEIGIALPLFGTTLTQAAALYTIWGAEKTDLFFKQIEESDIQILNGNSSVRDYVSQGKLSFGLTDTDDACSAIEKGKPVRMIIPDQDSLGTLVIPNTVALIKGGPNPELGKKFIDYLLHPTTLNDLIASGWCHVPLRKADESPSCMETDTILAFKVNLDSIYTNYVRHRKALKQQFLK